MLDFYEGSILLNLFIVFPPVLLHLDLLYNLFLQKPFDISIVIYLLSGQLVAEGFIVRNSFLPFDSGYRE